MRVQKLAGKVVASMFWDAEGGNYGNFQQMGITINSYYYCTLLRHLREELKEWKRWRAVFFCIRTGAPPHKVSTTHETLHDCGFELLRYPPCFSDLAPLDFFLFPDLKKDLNGRRFDSDDAVIDVVNSRMDS